MIFTGDNDSFNTSGFFPADQDALAEWLDSGGRLWVTGQNIAETTDSNTFESTSIGRARLYHGYLGLRYDDRQRLPGRDADAHRRRRRDHGRHRSSTSAPTATAIDNQTSIEAGDAVPDNDTFQAADTMTPLFDPIGDDEPAGSAISFSRVAPSRASRRSG